MAKKPTAPAPAADQPYYLQRAHIKDFRSIRDAAVEFKPGLNIIIGANGSGKTNFVECFPEASVFGSPPILTGSQQFILGNSSPIEIESVSTRNLNPYASPSHGALFHQEERVFKVSHSGLSAYNKSLVYAFINLREQVNIKNESKIDNLGFATIKVKYGIPQVYPLVKIPTDFTFNGNSVGWSLIGSEIFTSTVTQQIAMSLQPKNGDTSAKAQGLATNRIKEQIINQQNYYSSLLLPTLSRYTPIEDIRIAPTYSIYFNSTQQEILVKGIIFEFKTNNDWLPFIALSSGTQRLFYVISETLTPILYLPEDKIILLEEPELGIHPDQLEKLLLFLREQSQKHQLIITTHSPQVLDMLNDDELDRITICELDKKKGTQFRKLKKTQIAAAKKYMSTQGLYLSDYWRYGSLENTH